MEVPAARAATTPTPGALISGFTSASPRRGPVLLNWASLSCLSTAPTVSADAAAPGEVTERPAGPLLPAATTNSAPVSAESLSTSALRSSLPSVTSPPRLRLTIFAPDRAAHSMPAITWEVSASPAPLKTLAMSSLAPGATPLYLPPEPWPVLAMVAATCVPWPCRSTTSGSSEKFSAAVIFEAMSGWVASMPVSTTATVTPVPSRPAFQASGAPICFVVWSSATWIGRSYFTRTPDFTLMSRDCQNSRAFAFSTWMPDASRVLILV